MISALGGYGFSVAQLVPAIVVKRFFMRESQQVILWVFGSVGQKQCANPRVDGQECV